MEDIILEESTYGSYFLLTFDDFCTHSKLELEKNELIDLRDKINNILEETR